MIAQTIFNQLGGNRFAFMTGATCFSNGNQLIVKFKGSMTSNIAYFTLESDDTYSVRFGKARGMNVKTVCEISGIYAEMLTKYFTKVTGLYTSL